MIDKKEHLLKAGRHLFSKKGLKEAMFLNALKNGNQEEIGIEYFPKVMDYLLAFVMKGLGMNVQ